MITRDRRGPRDIRHIRLREKVRGSAGRPRLAVFRSINHIYAPLVDDDAGKTVLAVDSRSKTFREGHKSGGNVAAAKAVGELLAQKATAAGVQNVANRASHGVRIADGQGRPCLHLVDRHAAERIAYPLSTGHADRPFDHCSIRRRKDFTRRRRVRTASG